MLNFIEGGMRLPVGVHDAVAAKIGVGAVRVPVVSAVGPAPLFVVQALVHPVPDKAALQLGIGIDGLPLEVQRAGGIAHGMGVL